VALSSNGGWSENTASAGRVAPGARRCGAIWRWSPFVTAGAGLGGTSVPFTRAGW